MNPPGLYPQVTADLQVLAGAVNYRRWLFDHVAGGLGGRILEIGSGLGNYTSFFLEHGVVWATDSDEAYLEHLRQAFAQRPDCTVSRLELGAQTAEQSAALHEFSPTAIVCLNVLEHVEDDAAAVRFLYESLAPGGSLRFIVPAAPRLYSPLDRAYGHYRRYARTDISRLLAEIPDARVEKCRYFNLVGVLGWWFNYVLLERKALRPRQVRLFDRLVPVMARLENVVAPPFGLSLVLWVGKPE